MEKPLFEKAKKLFVKDQGKFHQWRD